MKRNILMGFGIVFGILILCMVLFISLTAWTVTSNNKPKGNKQEKLISNMPSFKKALVIYQPGKVSSIVAHQIAKGLNEGGYEVILDYPGEHLPADISEYPVVVFGTPVYAGQPSKVLTDYMAKVKDYSQSKVTLFSVGMLENPVELDTMEKSLSGKKANRKVKFISTNRKENDKKAYDLGIELSKE